MPALFQNSAVKPSLLAHIAPRISNRAFGAGCHARGPEIFNADNSVVGRNTRRLDVAEMLADAGCASLCGRETSPRLLPADATALASSKSPAMLPCPAIEEFESLNRHIGEGAIGERQGLGDSTVDADTSIGGRRPLGYLDFASEGYMPTQGITAHGDVEQLAFNAASPAEADFAYLRKADDAPRLVEPAERTLSGDKPEGLIDAFAARSRVAGDAFEETGVGFVEIAQGLLLAGLRDGGDPIEFGAEIGEFLGLGDVAQGFPGVGLVLSIPVAALFQSQIVDQTADAGELTEHGFLSGSRFHLEFEGAMDDQLRGPCSVTAEPVKSASLACRPAARSHFVPPININSKRQRFRAEYRYG